MDRMLRFLRGHSQDAEAAAEAYGSMLAWRQTNDIEGTVRSAVLGKELTEASLPHFERITELGLKGAINAGWTADGQVIPTPSHLLDHISPIFSPFFPVFCAFSRSCRGGSNEPKPEPRARKQPARGPRGESSPLRSTPQVRL